MGGFSTREEDKGKDWESYSKESGNEARLKNQYYQTQEARFLNPENSYGTANIDLQTDKKSVAAIAVDFELDQKSFKLVPDESEANLFFLQFSFWSKVPVKLRTIVRGKVSLNESHTEISSIEPKEASDLYEASFEPGDHLEVSPKAIRIDLMKVKIKEMEVITLENIPLVILLEAQSQLPGKLQKSISFFVIKRQYCLAPEKVCKCKFDQSNSRHSSGWKDNSTGGRLWHQQDGIRRKGTEGKASRG